jgi:PKD repeat protein
MAKKASHAAKLAADFLKIPTLFAGGSVALATWLLLLLGMLAPGGPLLAQQCQSEADFIYTVNGCDVEFMPSYSGPGTITSHSWIFTEDASNTSTSNITNPIHTFNGGNGLRTVLHTVSIMLPNGQFISASCTKTDIAVNCQNECNFFNYNVSGCTVTFSASQSGTWDFGDALPDHRQYHQYARAIVHPVDEHQH